MWWMAAAMAGDSMQVAGDVVILRAEPAADARPVVRLPIGTRVDTQGEKDGWTQISVASRPKDHPLSGWVRADLLTQYVEPAAAMVAHAKGADAAESRRWLDRAQALDPWDPAVIAERGAPRGPVWLATCDGERVYVVGQADPKGFRVRPATLTSDDRFVARDEMAARARSFVTWYHGEQLVSGRFLTPFLVPSAAIFEDGGDGWTAGVEREEYEQVLVLGGCHASERGAVFATGPLKPVAVRPGGKANLQKAAAAVDAGASGVIVHAGPRDGTEVVTFREARVPSCTDGGSELGTGAFYQWFAKDGVATEPFIANFSGDAQPGTGTAAWYTWQGTPIGFVYGSYLDAVTSVIRLDAAGHGTVEHLAFRYYGC